MHSATAIADSTSTSQYERDKETKEAGKWAKAKTDLIVDPIIKAYYSYED